MFNLNLTKVTETRKIRADGIKSDFYMRFADGVTGMLFDDGELRLTVTTERE